MDKRKKVIDAIPDLLKNVLGWAKNSFDENAKTVLDNSTGTIGIILKIFGESILNKYLLKLTKEKLEDYGLNTYTSAAYRQAAFSMEIIEKDLDKEITSNQVISLFEDITVRELKKMNENDVLLIFQPVYHPSIVSVRNCYVLMLMQLGANDSLLSKFKKHFNENIEISVQKEFGDDYDKHLESIKTWVLKRNETALLNNTLRIARIGFSESENLSYETTYAEWKSIVTLKKGESDFQESMDKKEEQKDPESRLREITELVDEYFNKEVDSIEKILFLVADFGKGKSVFLKHHASELARQYLNTGNGYFPVYFNLRNYSNYSSETKLGVISDYLQTKYGIDISNEYYTKKRFVFLIDSLDESGDLNRISIDKVINSVKRIQNLDKVLTRSNRIIITTRPFDDGLELQIENHQPWTVINEKGKEVSQYISIYGFKKEQVDNWLTKAIKSHISQNSLIAGSSLISKIKNSINNGVNFDFYNELLKSNTLSASELRRPIFSYMIYQLLRNNVDFLKLGKIGVYLSFLNLLSKEAKHVNDPNYKVNLKEEFEFRNILHCTSALWMSERAQGKQGILKKADICRVLDEDNRNELDHEILSRYKNKGVVEIEFLSHSYFGENDNSLHFQHQSFAEILLAEYYIKVFIKFSLDEEFEFEKARTKLFLGFPTDQTMIFFRELLQLIKEASVKSDSDEVLQKRKLLFPLISSLATKKNNYLFCNDIYYEWFKNCKLDDNGSEYPLESLKNWYLDDSKLQKIVKLSAEILNSKNNYYLAKAEQRNSLYNKELILLQNNDLRTTPKDIDRWLALITGNALYNTIGKTANPKLFNMDFQIDYNRLIGMILNIDTINSRVPFWAKDLFMGLDMRMNESQVRFYNVLNLINFSYCYLKNVDFSGCLLGGTRFDYSSFENINLSHSYMWGTSFKAIKIIGECNADTVIVNDILIPFDLFGMAKGLEKPQGIPKIMIRKDSKELIQGRDIAPIISQILAFYELNGISTTNYIESNLSFENKADETWFSNKVKSSKKAYRK